MMKKMLLMPLRMISLAHNWESSFENLVVAQAEKNSRKNMCLNFYSIYIRNWFNFTFISRGKFEKSISKNRWTTKHDFDEKRWSYPEKLFAQNLGIFIILESPKTIKTSREKNDNLFL